MGKGKTDKNKDTAKQQDKPGRGARNQKLDPAMFGLGGTLTLGGLGQLGAVAGLTCVSIFCQPPHASGGSRCETSAPPRTR